MENNQIQRTQLKTDRSLLKFLLLTILTFGIYGIVVMQKISNEINVVASKYDNKHTMSYVLVALIFSWLTFGIVPLVWNNNICQRMGQELQRRNIDYSFGAGTFWGWGFLGSLIVVGPFIFQHKFFQAMNKLNASYNEIG